MKRDTNAWKRKGLTDEKTREGNRAIVRANRKHVHFCYGEHRHPPSVTLQNEKRREREEGKKRQKQRRVSEGQKIRTNRA